MIGLDTNILLRYLIQDDPAQFETARQLIEETLSIEDPGFVSLVTLSELAWTLKRTYKLPSSSIAAMMEQLISSYQLVLQNEQEVFLAVAALEEGGDFPDALVATLGLWAGSTHTLTFDRKASRLPGMKLI